MWHILVFQMGIVVYKSIGWTPDSVPFTGLGHVVPDTQHRLAAQVGRQRDLALAPMEQQLAHQILHARGQRLHPARQHHASRQPPTRQAAPAKAVAVPLAGMAIYTWSPMFQYRTNKP